MKLEQIEKIIGKGRMLEILGTYLPADCACNVEDEEQYPDTEWFIVRRGERKLCGMNLTNLLDETVEAFEDKVKESLKPVSKSQMDMLLLEALNETMLVKLAPLLVVTENADRDWNENEFKDLIAEKLKGLKVNAQFRVSISDEDIKEKEWNEVIGDEESNTL